MIQLRKVIIVISVIGLSIFLSLVFRGRLILPQTFRLGWINIHYYGIIIALAVACGYYLAEKRREEFGITYAVAQNLLFWIIVGSFLGARLYHVLSSIDYYRAYAIEIFKVWNGGLSIYGAILGGLITVVIYQLAGNDHDRPLWRMTAILDWLTPSLILGQIIGRLGNLFNYEAFGYPTNLPWKMFVPVEFRPVEYQTFAFFHPWFLYEQMGLLIILMIIGQFRKRRFPLLFGWSKTGLRGQEKKVTAPDSDTEGGGRLFLWYLLLYNVLRFGLEFLRIDSVMVGPLRLNVITSFLIALIAAVVIFSGKLVPRRDFRINS